MAQKTKLLVVSLFILLGASCGNIKKKNSESPLARVYELYLYPSDLADNIPPGISNEDSIRIVRRLVEEWARDRLLLRRAEQYLSYDQKNIEKQIEDYRLSLLTFKYKQNLLAQNLDSIVSDLEIQAYYEQYSSNYILDSDVVKATFIKVPVTATQLDQVRRWYKSNRIEDLDQLEKYCMNHSDKYFINAEKWITFTELIEGLPLKVDNPGRFLSYTKHIEVRDSLFIYFIRINDRIPESHIAPVEMVKSNIRNVILNKRKIEFIQNLENSVFKDGLSRNQVEIF